MKLDKTVLYPKFNYYDLDLLKTTDPLKILSKNDKDEIHQIYIKTYQPYKNKTKQNLADFYIFLIENYCIHVDVFIEKMDRLFKLDNPFQSVYYVLDGVMYLYNKELISYIPSFDDNMAESPNEEQSKPKNEYRTIETRLIRVPRSRV